MAVAALRPERFAQGMTFDQYVAYTGSPENLTREAGWWLGPVRRDLSGLLREWYETVGLTDVQVSAIRWLAGRPHGPAKLLVISEEWSSDCRRDVPMLARLAEAGGLELRIFTRDGAKVGRGSRADPAESPNADLVNAFLREQNGATFQSIPVAVFYTRDWRYLHHYLELPAIYHRDRLAAVIRAVRPGETQEQWSERWLREWTDLQRSPFFRLWAHAAIDEILSALYERLATPPP